MKRCRLPILPNHCSVCLSVCLSLSLFLFVSLSLSLFLSLSVSFSFSLSVCLSASVCRSLSLCLCLSVFPILPERFFSLSLGHSPLSKGVQTKRTSWKHFAKGNDSMFKCFWLKTVLYSFVSSESCRTNADVEAKFLMTQKSSFA